MKRPSGPLFRYEAVLSTTRIIFDFFIKILKIDLNKAKALRHHCVFRQILFKVSKQLTKILS